MIDKKLLVMSGKKQKRQLFSFFFLLGKNSIYVSVQKVVCFSHQSDRVG